MITGGAFGLALALGAPAAPSQAASPEPDQRPERDTHMQELVFVGKDQVEWQEVRRPRLEDAGQALVRPLAVAACDLDRAIIIGSTPYTGPFAIGHECIAEVLEVGESVATVRPGDRVCVPFQISCGVCTTCRRGFTGNCENVPRTSTYGFGPPKNPWGGMLANTVRVPFADSMLMRVPRELDPVQLASLSDNIPDGWRAVVPYLDRPAQSRVLVIGGLAKSVSLYAAAVAVAIGVPQVDYLDTDLDRLDRARRLGANAIEGKPGKPMGPYTLTVDGSCTAEGLQCALLSTEPEGICFSVSIYLSPVSLVLAPVYARGVTFKTGRSHARPALPKVLQLIESGKLRPELVTSRIATWSQAADALLEGDYTKLVITAQSA